MIDGYSVIGTVEKLLEILLEASKEIVSKIDAEEEWFRNLWENNANMYDFYELAKVIKPSIKLSDWEIAWSKTLVLSEDFETGKTQFANALLGWY